MPSEGGLTRFESARNEPRKDNEHERKIATNLHTYRYIRILFMTGVNLTRALKVLSQRETRLEIETSWKNSTEQTEEFVLAILRSVRKLKVRYNITMKNIS